VSDTHRAALAAWTELVTRLDLALRGDVSASLTLGEVSGTIQVESLALPTPRVRVVFVSEQGRKYLGTWLMRSPAKCRSFPAGVIGPFCCTQHTTLENMDLAFNVNVNVGVARTKEEWARIPALDLLKIMENEDLDERVVFL
jgi:hypothetical protein